MRISDWSADVCSSDLGFLYHLLDARIEERVPSPADIRAALRARQFNLQAGRRSYEVGKRHYDLGNDLYRAMLGKRLVYSCGYWRQAENLDDAQEAKLDLICRKLGLREGMRVLDIGRSEEHTSELQSLMRISYAVFCLKKKKKSLTLPSEIQINTHHTQQ